ncbi:MAG: helix-turn-helix transcriptional regulator [Candidatus Theseobacter exili]|nr:helix-turn-helix transcriptional regulator [Candidatus Theseobacter exili]
MEYTIPQTILRIRQHKNWSQERFAQEIGVSFSTVNAWERGRRKPQPFLKKLILQLANK